MADKKYKLGEVLITREQIAARVAEMGKEIAKDYEGKELLVVGILRGSVPFMADLIREIDNPLTIDFMSVSSYGASTKTSGVVRILKDM
ncbi:MAG: hypoxanthine phosphoribosyltransferase, partial [Firmicutes bacterium]|nr:hypoxanthine phosphoribosyltransferase [Bacillota bacterium]